MRALILPNNLGALLFLAVWSLESASAEVFILKSGGRIEGELLNRQRAAGQPYHVRTGEGVQLALGERLVQRALVKTDLDRQYEELLAKSPDTAPGHWELAEWCKEVGLVDQRKEHLEAVISLEPDHEQARKALGYSRYGSRWLTTEEYMQSQGYVRYKGAWRSKQEAETEALEREQELAVKQWRQNIRRWFEQLVEGSRHAAAADRELSAIQDSHAAPALAELLANSDQPRGVRLRCLDILGKLPPGLATPVCLKLAMDESDGEIRDRCLDEIKRHGTHVVLPRLLAELKNKDNARVNRAAECLERLGDKDATLPLIDALITEHQFQVSPGGTGGGGMPLSFGSTSGPGQSGLGSFGVQGRPKVIKKQLENPGVRNALVSLHPGVNYNFDVGAWKRWYIQSQTSATVDLRRDD
jgi:hypothetical protein